MVNVKIGIRNDQIQSVVIEGHADSACKGEDLVCAGVSSIGVGVLNTLDELAHNKCHLEMDNGYINVQVKENNDIVQTILHTVWIQLKTMSESYKEYIKITKEEV